MLVVYNCTNPTKRLAVVTVGENGIKVVRKQRPACKQQNRTAAESPQYAGNGRSWSQQQN